MNKFLARLFILCAGVVLTILVNINGWGLQPKSWGWIIGMGVCGQMLLIILGMVISREDK